MITRGRSFWRCNWYIWWLIGRGRSIRNIRRGVDGRRSFWWCNWHIWWLIGRGRSIWSIRRGVNR
jgi:hypothetical protein